MEPPPNNLSAYQLPKCQVGWFVQPSTGWVLPTRCKRWQCPECGSRRQRQFIKRISQRPAKGYFATFTVDRDGSASRENIKRLNKCWRPLSQWLKRNAALSDTTWVNEIGSAHGRIHKHAVLSCSRFDYREARAAVVRAGFGAVCNFQPIKLGQAGANTYVSKYLGKNLAGPEWPKYARRCQTTIPAEKTTHEFTFEKLKLPPWIGEWQELRANKTIDSALFAENMRLEREAQTWTPQLELPLTSTTEEKVHHTTEGWIDGQTDESVSRGPPDSS